MENFEDFKESLIASGYSEEMAQTIAEGLVKAIKPTSQKGEEK